MFQSINKVSRRHSDHYSKPNIVQETPEETAFREAFEEIGLEDKHIDVWALTPDEVRITLENGSENESSFRC